MKPAYALALFCAMPLLARGAAPAVAATAALADPARPGAEVALDPLRKPAEVIEFAGVGPGERVADFMSGNGYFTRILSGVVGPSGHVYAYLPSEQLARCAPQETQGTKALVREAHYGNVTLLTGAAGAFAAPEPLDLVWTAQDYHDLHDKFMAPTDVAAFNAAVFRALKPGGAYLVIDHAAAAGSGLRDTDTLHRIDPQAIKSEVTAAGFVLERESALLANPADAHTLAVFDPAIRHHTDQVILLFRKPGGAAR
jgi:predicted methyltransferase